MLLIVLLVAVVATACDSDSRAAMQRLVDAGVENAEDDHRVPLDPSRITDTLRLVPPRALDRVTAAAFIGDSAVAVADARHGTIDLFRVDGRHLRRLGGLGESLGHYQWIVALRDAGGGRVLVYDNDVGRVTLLDRAGRPVKAISVTLPSGVRPSDVWLDNRGEMWGVIAGPTAGYPHATAEGLVLNPAYVVRFRDGGVVDTSFTIIGDELFLMRASSGAFAGFRLPPYGINGAWATDGERIYARLDRGPSVGVYDSIGTLLRIFRWADEDRGVTRTDAARAQREAPELPWGIQPLPTERPAFGRLVAAPGGKLLVSEYAHFGYEPQRWTVLDSNGIAQARLRLGKGTRILDVAPHRILVKRTEASADAVMILFIER